MRRVGLVVINNSDNNNNGWKISKLDPISLRSLDAIHVATALEIGSELGKFYCYDIRLKEAAEAQGLNVESPQ